MKNKKKKDITKQEKQPFVKTRVKPDNSVEVELKNPSKTFLGKLFVILIVIGMTVVSLLGLILLIIQVA